MSSTVPTTHQTAVRLPSGRELRIVLTLGGPTPDDAIPHRDAAAAIFLMVDEDTADAEAVGQALLDLLHAGEAAQRESAASAARLAATVAEVAAAARAVERDQ